MNWLKEKVDNEPARDSKSTQNTPSTPAASSAPYTPYAAATLAPKPVEPAPAPAPRGMASIGKSIHVKGELSGSEDLAIEGRVEGKINLSGCRVTIGASGQVTADIVAKSVIVAGTVKGRVQAEERVEVAASGNLLGDVRSPRVVLVDGAKFKGAVDMEPSASSNSNSTSSKAMKHDPLLVPEEVTV